MGKEQTNVGGVMYNSLTNGSKIVGKIQADSDFRIDGEVEGDIVCKGKLIIGQHGSLRGTIVCVNAEILGLVEGSVEVAEMLTLRSTAQITGEVKTNVLMVEPNAKFNGSCSMSDTHKTEHK